MLRFFKRLQSKLQPTIGIDLGTANTVVFNAFEGIIIREPSIVALNVDTNEVIAIGNKAYDMIGRTPSNIVAVRPLKEGVIANFHIAEQMLKYFIKKAANNLSFIKPRILVGIPWGITSVEKRAVCDSALRAGTKEAVLIDEPMAAAIGLRLDVFKPNGIMVVDIGGGTTEVGVISLGGLVVCKSIRIAGDEFDAAIINHCKKNYNLLIGDRMAEQIKIAIGSAYPFEEEKTMQVRGRELLSGLPKTFTVSSLEIRDALSECISSIIDAIKLTLEKTPPELSSDIIINGIYLTGGGSLLYGLSNQIMEETEMPVHANKDPLSSVAVGTGIVLEDNLIPRLVNAITSH